MKIMGKLFLILSLLVPVTVLPSSASLAETKLEATIFSYDGEDFVRTETTLMKDGQSAVGTKLDRDSAAYKALVEKRSYTGSVTVFGKEAQGSYAPLIGEDGKLTGALFVGVPKQSDTDGAPETFNLISGRGDLVTHDGSIYHANAETRAKPGNGSTDWTLAVKRGADGKDAERRHLRTAIRR